MIPLATIGFASAALLFAGYAACLHWYTRNAAVPRSYPLAHYGLALAFLFWSASSAIGDPTLLAYSVIAGNALILFGTVCIINGFVPRRKMLFTALAAILGCILLLFRIISFPPHPYLESGVLVFNTDASVAALYTLLFLCVWLPANMVVGNIVGAFSGDYRFWIKWLFGVSTFAALLFPTVRSLQFVIGTFLVLVMCYGTLIGISIYLRNEYEKKRGSEQRRDSSRTPYDALPWWLKKIITFFAISVVLNIIFPNVIPELFQNVLSQILAGVGGALLIVLLLVLAILSILGIGGGMSMGF